MKALTSSQLHCTFIPRYTQVWILSQSSDLDHFSFLFLWCWSLNSGLWACQAHVLPAQTAFPAARSLFSYVSNNSNNPALQDWCRTEIKCLVSVRGTQCTRDKCLLNEWHVWITTDSGFGVSEPTRNVSNGVLGVWRRDWSVCWENIPVRFWRTGQQKGEKRHSG